MAAKRRSGIDMPKFLLLVSERHAVTYLVKGESADQIEDAWEQGEVDQAVKVNDNFIANDIVSTIEEPDWSPLEKAWVKRAMKSTTSHP
jgi:hypothetical protein